MFSGGREFLIFERVIDPVMCTVTLVPLPATPNGFVLSSNRDEAVLRKTLPPEIYSEAGTKLLYPKDAEAGGSWIGLSERKRCICLLNGGFEKHLRKPPYKKSRGLVVRELLAARNFNEKLKDYNFEGIEPFTAIVVEYQQQLKFLELVWDGTDLHLRVLPLKPDIWSSTLLYSSEEVALRRQKFETFKKHHPLTPENILKFHSFGGETGEEGLIIDRGFLKTCSITQIINGPAKTSLWYRDLATEVVTEKFLK